MNAVAERPESDVVLVQAERRPAMPPAEVSEPVAQVACGKLSAALATARDRCKMAAKGSYNSFHKYAYASADEIILTAKESLEGTGLAIIPQKQRMSVLALGNKAVYTLDRTIFLSHASGEFVPLTVEGWPVIPDNGRPLDKALATALTTSMAYLLRDLLQMPRGESEDMNARNDTAEAKPAARTEPAPAKTAAQPELATLRNELGTLIRNTAAARDMEPDDVFRKLCDAIMHKFPNLPETTSRWERNELVWAIDSLKRSQPAPRQPGEDPPEVDDGINEPPMTTEEKAAAAKVKVWESMRDQTLEAMKGVRVTWPNVIKGSLQIIGRALPSGAMVKDLSLDELGRIKGHCDAIRKAQPTAA